MIIVRIRYRAKEKFGTQNFYNKDKDEQQGEISS